MHEYGPPVALESKTGRAATRVALPRVENDVFLLLFTGVLAQTPLPPKGSRPLARAIISCQGRRGRVREPNARQLERADAGSWRIAYRYDMAS